MNPKLFPSKILRFGTRAPSTRDILQRAVNSCVEPLERRMLLSTTLQPVADTFARNGVFADTNSGAAAVMYLKNGASDDRIAYLKFNIGDLASVGAATLNLNLATQTNAPPLETGVFVASDSSWAEGTGTNPQVDATDGVPDGVPDSGPADGLTWNTRPDISSTPLDVQTVNDTQFHVYSYDVTSYVQQARTDGLSTITLAVTPSQEAEFREQLASREFGGGFGPELVVEDAPPPPPSDTQPPDASISAGDVNTAGGTSQSFTVTFTDNVSLNVSSIDTGDVTVTGPGGAPLNVTNVSTVSTNNDATVVATYTVTPPEGSWDSSDTGSYQVNLGAGSVLDDAGNPVAAVSQSFRVNIAAPDTQNPTASISVGNVTTPGASHAIVIRYADDFGIDTSRIGIDDISVTGQSGALQVGGVDISGSGTSVTATYTVNAPGGIWDAADNGVYGVILKAGQVFDTSQNAVRSDATSFTVNVAAPDNNGPTASLSAANVNAPGGASTTVTAVYTDDKRVDASSIDTSDIVVQGPAGTLQVTSVDVSNSGGTTTAVYTVAAPGGAWNATHNGPYTVTLQSDAVRDNKGNPAAPTSTTFSVNATVVDNQAPTASIAAADVTTGGGVTQTVSVTYSDNIGIDLTSIGTDDLTIAGPKGQLPITVASIGGGGASISVSYTFSAPGDSWDASDNGPYTVSVNSNQVRDTSGKPVSAASASFTVNVPAPQPLDQGFNGGNVVSAGFVVEAMATQSNGQIIVAGHRGDLKANNSVGVLRRLNSDGSLDTTFGSGGEVVTGSGANDAFYAVTVQGERGIVVAGAHGGDFLLSRYDLTGKLDATFADGGRAVTDLGGADDAAYGIAPGPGGTFVIAGNSGGNFAFARYDSNGLLDPTFAQRGKQLFDLGSDTDVPGAVAVQADGKVVAVGSSGGNVAIVRLLANGSADLSFSGDGLLIVPGLAARQDAGAADRSEALAIQTDGKILVGNHTTDNKFAITRIDTNGNVDSGFGDNGVATAGFSGNDDVDSIVLQGTGEILVVGTSLAGGTPSTAIAAFNSVGLLIQSFGNGGGLTVDAGVTATSRELHIGDLVLRAFGTRQPDGKLIIGTSDQSPAPTSSALRRLIVPGTSAQPQGTSLGAFGIVNGKNTRLTITVNGTTITLSLKGGTGNAFQSGDTISLVLTDGGAGVGLSIKAKGGRVHLGDVTVSGVLKSLSGKTSDLSGTLFASVAIGKVTLGNVTGMIVTPGSISSVNATGLSGAKILSGTNLGSDGSLGGTDAAADTHGQGSIGAIKVKGAITSSLIGSGLDPVDGTYSNGDDRVIGGVASTIKSISAQSADEFSKFVAGFIKSAKLPKKVTLATDPRFQIL